MDGVDMSSYSQYLPFIYHLLLYLPVYRNLFTFTFPNTYTFNYPIMRCFCYLRLLLELPFPLEILPTISSFLCTLLRPQQIRLLRLLFLHLIHRPLYPLQFLQSILQNSSSVPQHHSIDIYPYIQYQYVFYLFFFFSFSFVLDLRKWGGGGKVGHAPSAVGFTNSGPTVDSELPHWCGDPLVGFTPTYVAPPAVHMNIKKMKMISLILI